MTAKLRYRVAIAFMLMCAGITGIQTTEAGDATDQVRQTVDAVLDVLRDSELNRPAKKIEREKALREIIEKRFDFEEMARRSLARHWSRRTKEEQKEFVEMYSDLLENTYIQKIERYENEKVEYADEKTDGAYAVVKTRISGKGNAIPVDYKILRKDGRWSVYDIIIEGVSLVNNYRSQFDQVISSQSYEDLVRRLKEKTKKKE